MYRSKEITKYQTAQIPQWREGNTTYRGEVTYGMHYIFGNSSPYFSITALTERKTTTRKGFNASQCKETVWVEDSCGCLHDLIKKKAPHLASLIEFHLADQDGLPMHYLENGWYWYKEDKKVFLEQCRVEYFEVADMPVTDEKEVLVNWLMSRTKALKQRFDDTMKHFNVEYITQREIDTIKAA